MENHNRKIEIKQRPAELGSDWSVKLYEDDREEGGAVYPQDELDNALEFGRCWLINQPYID